MGSTREAGVGIRTEGSEKRGDKIDSARLNRMSATLGIAGASSALPSFARPLYSCILCAPAGPLPLNNRLLRNHSVALLWRCTQASLVLTHNKTTGHLRGRLFKGGEDKNILQVIQQYIVVDFEPIAALKKHIIVYNASMAFARLDAADTSPASPREAGFFCLFPL